ncbi:hemerythrin domain-containing protein [Sphaerotilus sp.]|uniref:hemerythrin domain-containing protein n=1 Tax=Sphaerotilus sp. TaxID=2093942 RepID=UPI002ACDC899|nr:hemerythrin domain-containing protein [Sphaerotilus sp.]MDZ7858633.1 hemerythrin domain-containing protein [Sphaerotilus sp.]
MTVSTVEVSAVAVPPSLLSPQAPQPQDFEALDSCHREVMVTLNRLVQLIDHLAAQGPDATAQGMASEIVSFFNQTARAHHADEERLIFPDLLRSDDTVLVQHVQRLQQDHGWLEEDWLTLAPPLDAVAQGYSWYDLDMLRQATAVFTELYMDHIDLEESLIYPEAKRLMRQRPGAGSGRARAAARH